MLPGLTVIGPNQLDFIEKFKADAMAGTLPEISYIIPQDEITEHPPNLPRDGGWQQKAIIDALVNSPSYKDSALFITYDGKLSFVFKFTGFDLCSFVSLMQKLADGVRLMLLKSPCQLNMFTGDHVTPFHSDPGTEGEWMINPVSIALFVCGLKMVSRYMFSLL